MTFAKAATIFLVILVTGAGWFGIDYITQTRDVTARRNTTPPAAPVEVAPVVRQSIELRRQFTGTLDANTAFVVAAKIGGRIEEIAVDLGDTVTRGQLIARLDHAEYEQILNQVKADLLVAQANLNEAQSLMEIAQRDLDRVDILRQRGVSSESESDAAQATYLSRAAHVEVSHAQVIRAEAELETARIRLRYSDVSADWRGGDNNRSVAERYVDEGETVTANQPLLKIVELNVLTGVFYVTERDYSRLKVGQLAQLATDAYPGEFFEGRIQRISPVFDETSRQARVEMMVDNGDLRLKPGMFIRANVELDRKEDAIVVPEQALVTRDGITGVFIVDVEGGVSTWRTVVVGIHQDDLVEVDGEGIQGSVVVLGQQLLDDGSPILVVNNGQP